MINKSSETCDLHARPKPAGGRRTRLRSCCCQASTSPPSSRSWPLARGTRWVVGKGLQLAEGSSACTILCS